MSRYLTVAIAAGVVFNLVMLCGLYVRLEASETVSELMASSASLAVAALGCLFGGSAAPPATRLDKEP